MLSVRTPPCEKCFAPGEKRTKNLETYHAAIPPEPAIHLTPPAEVNGANPSASSATSEAAAGRGAPNVVEVLLPQQLPLPGLRRDLRARHAACCSSSFLGEVPMGIPPLEFIPQEAEAFLFKAGKKERAKNTNIWAKYLSDDPL